MIRLFDAKDTYRSGHGLGICGIDDFVKCTVTEELNGEYFLEGEYPHDGMNAQEIMVDRMIAAIPNRKDAAENFRIAKIDAQLTGTMKITAYHHSYDLNSMIVVPNPGTYETAIYWLNYWYLQIFPQTHPSFSFYSNTGIKTTSMPAVDHPMPFRQIMMGMEGSILDIYGGEYHYEGQKISLLAARGSDTGKKIIYGANMTTLKQEISAVDARYGVIPYFMSEENGAIIGSFFTRATDYDAPFDKAAAVDLTETWKAIQGETEPTGMQLDAFAVERIGKIMSDPTVSIDTGYIELADSPEYSFLTSGNIGLGDYVTVVHPATGLNLKAKIVKTVYNVLTGRYDSIVIGTIKKNLVDILRRIK